MILSLLVASSASLFSQSTCEYNFPVKVKDNVLVLNDGSDRRFFLAGMVDNDAPSGMQLSNHNSTEIRQQIQEAKAMGCNSIRWNAFLKGLDLEWDVDGNVIGVCPDCLSNLKDGLDLAHEEGMLVQVVLSTAHFLKYGFGGATNEINGIVNQVRVDNNFNMLTTEQGVADYIANVIEPMCDTIGTHPALLGFVVINEAYGMTDKQDTPNGGWADQNARLNDLRRFVNRVTGSLHRELPGVLCSVSGLAKVGDQYNDVDLVSQGGDADGVLDLNQMQFYPLNHNLNVSPFSNDRVDLATDWDYEDKPTIAGEFPIEGIANTWRNPEAFTLEEAYEALWDGGYSGGFTWSNVHYESSSGTAKTDIETGYTNFYNAHLSTLDPYENWNESLCLTTSLAENAESDLVSLFPNPAESYAVLTLDATLETEKVTVSSQSGEVVSTYDLTSSAQEIRLDTEHLADGLYYVTVQGAGVSRTMKLFVD